MTLKESESRFSVDNLEVFKRPGCTIEKRVASTTAGVWVDMANGWRVSIQWGAGNYGDNYGKFDDPPTDSTTAEIAVMAPGHNGDTRTMVSWGTDPEWAETVQGYCSMDRVQNILSLVARGELMQEYQPPIPAPVMRAIDGWKDGQ